jgi:hypothetical protein
MGMRGRGKVFVGRALARRGDAMGTEMNPASRASGSARPTGVVFGGEVFRSAGLRGSSTGSTLRWLGRRGESGNAGVGQCPTHGDCFRRRGFQGRGSSWVKHWLDAALAWAQGRIRERGRRAVPDPRGLFSAARFSGARVFVGRALARRCVGLGAGANPGTRASGSARPTGVMSSAAGSKVAGLRGSSTCSTLRWLGRRGESGNAGVGQCPTHGGCFRRRGFPERGSSWVEPWLDAALPWAQR